MISVRVRLTAECGECGHRPWAKDTVRVESWRFGPGKWVTFTKQVDCPGCGADVTLTAEVDLTRTPR